MSASPGPYRAEADRASGFVRIEGPGVTSDWISRPDNKATHDLVDCLNAAYQAGRESVGGGSHCACGLAFQQALLEKRVTAPAFTCPGVSLPTRDVAGWLREMGQEWERDGQAFKASACTYLADAWERGKGARGE